jgi:rod shape determining protein RodA
MRRLLLFFERFDWILLIAVLTLTSIGLVIIYGIGVSREPNNLFPFYKQLLALGIGAIAVTTLSFLDYRQLRSLSVICYLAGLVALIGVLFIGREVNGTRGWFGIGPLSFQPVEFAKITLIVYLATFFTRQGHGRLLWRVFAQSGVATFIYVGLVMLQPDFGSAMVMLGVWGFLCLFAGLPKRALIVIPTIALIAGGLLWQFGLRPYQKDRILAFTHPEQVDLRGSGYNAAQARIAIGSGGWLGKGIGEGSQARLRFLPEAGTDFIFAVVGEELGFVGITITISLFGLVLYRFVQLAQDTGDDFATLLLIGMGSVFFIHLFVNAGMNLGVVPVTGIPLPFVSSAASSLTIGYLMIGLAESVAVRRRFMNGAIGGMS